MLGICLLIVIIPTRLLDVLLVTNLAISAVVLLVALYTPDARRLPAFPTILLLTTLLRLALNVSSTRLILIQQNAGEVIAAFGAVVVGKSPIVGGVVFLVLVIVQFIVIAKGAERVAEVAARFTLDAMPGKQMSLDAELRSGMITPEQAREQRSQLERESRLYGAMDGAMKFVKGDAIAGVIISIINIAGGVMIGVFEKGLRLGEAASLYGRLTIGDGLCAQIPSILTSVAAGLVVTRVASAEDAPVGSDLGKQFFRQPQALAIVAVALLLLGALPLGFPPLPFVLLGVLALGASVAAWRNAAATTAQSPTPEPARGLPAVCELKVHPDVIRQVDRETLMSLAATVADSITRDLGVGPGVPSVTITDQDVDVGGYSIDILDAPAAVRRLGGAASAAEQIVASLEETLRDQAYRFISIPWMHQRLESIRATEEGKQLVRAVTPAPLTLQQAAEVFQRLVREDVPVRQTSLILESMARWGQTIKNPQYLAERVRRDMAPILCARFASSPGRLTVLSLAPELEDMIRGCVEDYGDGQVVSMSPEDRAIVTDACMNAISQASRGGGSPVLLVENSNIRRPLRSIIERRLPGAVVMSYDELTREIVTHHAGTVRTAAAAQS